MHSVSFPRFKRHWSGWLKSRERCDQIQLHPMIVHDETVADLGDLVPDDAKSIATVAAHSGFVVSVDPEGKAGRALFTGLFDQDLEGHGAQA